MSLRIRKIDKLHIEMEHKDWQKLADLLLRVIESGVKQAKALILGNLTRGFHTATLVTEVLYGPT